MTITRCFGCKEKAADSEIGLCPICQHANPTVIITPEMEAEADALGYLVGQWRQYKNYCCLFCAFTTIFTDKMKKHQDEGIHVWGISGAGALLPQLEEDDQSDVPVW